MNRRKFILAAGTTATGMALGRYTDQTGELVPIITPKALKRGDTIALTAPAGAVFDQSYINTFEKKLTNLGFKVVKGQSLFAQEGYLAGSDELRAKELNAFFKDQSIRAIFTMRGGWGCSRILDLLDYQAIIDHPKIIMGYSDITSLIIAIQQKTGLITYHGPMGYSSWKPFSMGLVYSTLMNGEKVKFKNPETEENQLKTLRSGQSTGRLIGGNLTVVCSLIGTKYEPKWENTILFLEETGEEPYRIDRLFWQFKLAGVFDRVKGIVLGSFRKCEPEVPEKSFSLQTVFEQHFSGLTVPVYQGASFGHTIHKFTLPIGIKAAMDADAFTIQLLENPTVFNG